MKITDLALIEVTGRFTPPDDGPTERNVQPIDAYPDFADKIFGAPGPTSAAPDRHKAIFLEVRTDEGATGFWGAVDPPAAMILKYRIAEFVKGADALATERIWDVLRAWNRHSQSGYFMMAISALDCALWDLRGKAAGQPVYRLLGGPVKDPVPAYASMLGFSIDPDDMARRAAQYKALGYPAQKWFFRYGPIHGEEGLEKNVEMVAVLREALGDNYPFMFDAFHSWEVPYSIALGNKISEFEPAWLEEPVPSDQVEALARIRSSIDIPIATGEHVYSRWQVQQLLNSEAADVIQCDPDWCGGISELVKIAHLCSAYGVPLCPHGHSLHAALHVCAAMPAATAPYVEFLVNHQQRRQYFFTDFLAPENGAIKLSDKPGLGIELDSAKIETTREI